MAWMARHWFGLSTPLCGHAIAVPLLCVDVPLLRCAIAQESALQKAWQAIPDEGQIGHAQQAFHTRMAVSVCQATSAPCLENPPDELQTGHHVPFRTKFGA